MRFVSCFFLGHAETLPVEAAAAFAYISLKRAERR
jgi:hypothetical protein